MSAHYGIIAGIPGCNLEKRKELRFSFFYSGYFIVPKKAGGLCLIIIIIIKHFISNALFLNSKCYNT